MSLPPSLFPQHIIARKRDGKTLTQGEIEAFVRGATDGSWQDYQLTAMLMAICIRGMDAAETGALTTGMMRSGTVANLGDIPGIKVDKHSTGGVGDKVSLPLAPLVAACGVPVPMMSGRGLGHTGGTLDKLESIAGFRTRLSLDEYRDLIRRIGVAMIGQTDELAPADRKLYSLRDVTGTVESLPLICASIMSKKLAEGIDGLVLDVKFGSGAFMADYGQARALAVAMRAAGAAMGKRVHALLTSMEQPLGRAVGHSLEVIESVELLRGGGPADLRELTLALGAHMLLVGGVAADLASATARLEGAIASGAALAKFRDLVAAQGGDVAALDDFSRLPTAPVVVEALAPTAGYVTSMNTRAIGELVLALGGGRRAAADPVDHAVGLDRLVKLGEHVAASAPLARVHARTHEAAAEAAAALQRAILLADAPPPVHVLIRETLAESAGE